LEPGGFILWRLDCLFRLCRAPRSLFRFKIGQAGAGIVYPGFGGLGFAGETGRSGLRSKMRQGRGCVDAAAFCAYYDTILQSRFMPMAVSYQRPPAL